jgi:hypothetical protein
MKHLISLVIKYLMVAVVLGVVLTMLTTADLGDVLYLSVIVTLISYIVGDLVILPLTNNFVATIADAGISILTILLFNNAVLGENIYFGTALIASLVLAVGEWFFHKYVSAAVLPGRDRELTDDLRR